MEENTNLMQEKYMQFQMLQQQIKDATSQVDEITKRLVEVESIILSIKEISKVKSGNEILVPVSNGIFIKAEAKETAEFLVNIGEGGVVNKNTEQVIQMLEKQKVELLNLQTELTKEAKRYEGELMLLQKELEKINDSIKESSKEKNEKDEYEL